MKSAPAGKGGLFRNIFSLVSMIFRVQGVVSITFIILLITGASAIHESYDKKTLLPIFTKMGGQLVNHDSKLYVSALEIEESGGIVIQTKGETVTLWEKIKNIGLILKGFGKAAVNLWYLWFFIVILYKLAILFTNNESARLSNILLAVFLLVILQIGANFVIVDQTIFAEVDHQPTTAEKFTPFRGLMKFIQVSPKVFNPVYQAYTNETIYVSDEAVNGTLIPEEPPIINTINMLTG